MRRSSSWIPLVVLFASAAATAEARPKARLVGTDGEPSVVVDFETPSSGIVSLDSGMVAVGAPGFARIGEAGRPDLPTDGVLIAVPNGFRAEATVLSETRRSLAEGATAKPYVRQWRCSAGIRDVGIDKQLYESKAVYPESNIALEDVGMLQGVRLARVAFYPVQMDFGRQGLDVTDRAVVRIDFVKVDQDAAVSALPRSLVNLLGGVTVNAAASRNIVADEAPERMLVVVADQFQADLASLIAWKRSKGLIVDVVTYSAAGGSRTGVMSYVQSYYDQHVPKPTFLLLVGNGTTMPTFRRSTSSGSAASDYPFALLSGNDIVPDMVVGRLLADDSAALRVQIDKWLAYEAAPDLGSDWYAQGTTIASNEGSGPSDVQYAEMIQASLKGGTYTKVDKFYQGSQTATATNIIQALNEGRSWLTYFGHGSGTSWGSTNTTFSTSTIRGLSNANLPVIVDVACDNGSFVDIGTCFGEAWVTQTASNRGAGAVAYWGASVSTSWHEPAVMATGIAKRHFEQGIAALGSSLLAGQLYLIERMGTGANVVDNLEWYNLLGDPSLTMRTSAPRPLDMTYTVSNAEGDTVVVATVSTGGGVRVALSSSTGLLLGLGVSDADGKVAFRVGSGAAVSGSRLVASGYNLGVREIVLP